MRKITHLKLSNAGVFGKASASFSNTSSSAPFKSRLKNTDIPCKKKLFSQKLVYLFTSVSEEHEGKKYETHNDEENKGKSISLVSRLFNHT